MKKIILSGITVISFLISNAQTDTIGLKEIIISDNRIETPTSQFGKSIQVLKSEEIKELTGKSAADYLSTVAGVDVRQRGPEGIQSDIGIRGGTVEQSLLLLNNIKLNDPQTGHHNMNLPFTTEALDHIEVIKSSASRLYGINALTGSINFITKVPEKNMLFAGFYAGDFGLSGENVGLSFHDGNLGQYISYSHSQSNGYAFNTDFKNDNIFYQATYLKGNNRFNFFGGYTARDFGAASFYVPNSSEYEQTKTAFGAAQYEFKKSNFSFSAQIYLRYNQDHYIYLRSNPSVYENLHFTHTEGVELHGSYKSKFGETGFGVDGRIEQLTSNGTYGGLGVHQRNILGAFAEHKMNFFNKKLLVTPGIYLNSYTGNNIDFFPGIDISYHANRSVTLFASSDKAMRLPTYTDLYYNGPNNIGNPNLKPEQALNSEVGIKYNNNFLYISFAAFNRQSNNLIDWAKTDTSQKWQPLNVNNVTFNGVEFRSVIHVNHLLKTADLSYTYIDATFKQSSEYLSQYALSNIRQQAIGILYFDWIKSLTQSITFRYIDRVNMPNYFLVDSKISHTFKMLKVYAEASNIFNTQYVEAGYVNMPGRWFRAGVEIKINCKK